MSPFPPIGNTDINANVRNKSLCGVKICTPWTHQLLGHPDSCLWAFLYTLYGKHDGKFLDPFDPDFRSSPTPSMYFLLVYY